MPKSKRRKLKRRKPPVPMKVLLEPVSAHNSETGRDELYFVLNGQRVAKRGYPETPQAKTWVPLVKGFSCHDGFPDDGEPVFDAGTVEWMPEPDGHKH